MADLDYHSIDDDAPHLSSTGWLASYHLIDRDTLAECDLYDLATTASTAGWIAGQT
jgi:hypothetical protein